MKIKQGLFSLAVTLLSFVLTNIISLRTSDNAITSLDITRCHKTEFDSLSTAPLPGILNAQLGALIPSIEWMGTFGGNFNGNEYGFTELITGDRTYEFSHSDFFSTQAEIKLKTLVAHL